MSVQQLTPWQRMKAFEYKRNILEGRRNKCDKTEDCPVGPCSWPCLTYYHNGKENICCKPRYDYNFLQSDGYNQKLHRDDRRHPFYYMAIYAEEEYPCRTVPLLTNSNYGHRPPIDDNATVTQSKRQAQLHTFYRNNGFYPYCQNARSYNEVKLYAPTAFKANQNFGYTFVPPLK